MKNPVIVSVIDSVTSPRKRANRRILRRIGKSAVSVFGASTLALLFVMGAGFSASAHAQSAAGTMSVEELEAFIEEQKEALEAAIAERDRNMAAQKEIEEQLEAQKAKQAEIEKELEVLCDERKQLDPDSKSDGACSTDS